MLTLEQKNHLCELNAKNGYGLSLLMLKTMVTKHEKAYEKGDEDAMEAIEYRLTDVNFHHECGMLAKHQYAELRKELEDF